MTVSMGIIKMRKAAAAALAHPDFNPIFKSLVCSTLFKRVKTPISHRREGIFEKEKKKNRQRKKERNSQLKIPSSHKGALNKINTRRRQFQFQRVHYPPIPMDVRKRNKKKIHPCCPQYVSVLYGYAVFFFSFLLLVSFAVCVCVCAVSTFFVLFCFVLLQTHRYWLRYLQILTRVPEAWPERLPDKNEEFLHRHTMFSRP